jgi:ABC-type transporter Mla subunit MlaD
MSRHPADLVPPTPGSGRPYATVGLLMSIALAILVGGVIWLRGAAGPVYYAELREAPDLRVGAAVRYRGMPVGLVDDIAFTDTSVRLTIRLRRDDVPIRQGAGVRLRPSGILDDQELELVPSATPSAPVLRPGSMLGRAEPDSALIAEQARMKAALGVIAGEVLARRNRRDSATATGGAQPDSTRRP